jgi:hypothetical protein
MAYFTQRGMRVANQKPDAPGAGAQRQSYNAAADQALREMHDKFGKWSDADEAQTEKMEQWFTARRDELIAIR